MKFTDFLGLSPSLLKRFSVLVLSGDDAILGQIASQRYLQSMETPARPDIVNLRTITEFSEQWGEGSLFGARCWEVRLPEKVKDFGNLKPFLDTIPSNDDRLILNLLAVATGFQGGNRCYVTVECQWPKTKKERQNLVRVRLQSLGIDLPEKLSQLIGESIATSVELENICQILNIFHLNKQPISEVELNHLLGDSDSVRDHTRLILRGNLGELVGEIPRMEPMQLIGLWNSILTKLYLFLIQPEQEENPDSPHDSGESGDSKKPAKFLIPKYLVKEYRLAKKKYSSMLVRETINRLNSVSEKIRSGFGDDCQERLHLILRDLIQGSR